MRVFIYEYICGGGLAGHPIPESLAREGWAMLASIVEDFARVEGCEVTVTVDERLVGHPLEAHRIERLTTGNEHATICRVASQCDWTLVIAPEFDGILLDRVRWVEESGGRLLGPTSAGVAATADKLECGKLLERTGVAAVTGRVVSLNELSADNFPVGFPAVLKPVDGAGSQTTFLIPDRASVRRVLGEAAAEGVGAKVLVQPFMPGIPASVSFLIGPVGAIPLLAGEQLLSNDGRFRYEGGRIPLPQELAARAVALASRSVIAVPGLRGFVGVDLVLGHSALRTPSPTPHAPFAHPHCPGDVVIEINPRLTTSYVGLRALAQCNLAFRLLEVVEGRRPGPIEWRQDTVGFSADGRLT
jgi:predicted ATP-grasp superfamily ATP-dependent carboligase